MTGSDAPLFSIVIPYRDRLDNLRLALAALAEQTLGPTRFEVVIGAMEYSDGYLALCREYADRLDVVSVLSSRPWRVGHARNLAMRQATGDVLVLMDVDMALPAHCLQLLHERYFGYGQRACVVGQMIDYDNNTGDVTSVEPKPYEHYRKLLADLEATGTAGLDPRMDAAHVVPWAFAWTALLALPRAVVVDERLWFDPAFQGYGVEDLEWAYRVARTGTPVTMGREIFGVHLPHLRDVAANRRSEAPNYRYFLRTWPGLDVELACAFGDFAANEAYLDVAREVVAATGVPGGSLAVVRSTVDGTDELRIGVTVPPGRTVDGALPLVGLALPYEDGAVEHCRVLPPVMRLPERYRSAVLAEARRVSRTPVSPAEA